LFLEGAAIATTTFFVIYVITNSAVISIPFALFAGLIWRIRHLNRKVRKREELRSAWPEALDQIISGIYAGESLAQTLVGLSSRGPEILRPYFHQFARNLRGGDDFSLSLMSLKYELAGPVSDQICEAILLAKSLGGGELLSTMRSLRDFVRADLQLRKEIAVKQGWVKNSAYLSASAPWLLLLLLSSQPGTVSAFSEPTGVLILGAGVALTVLAFLWMSFLGRIKGGVRVFTP
jgi:tight adherence protein B